MDWLQAVILGIVQGITEFLPVSSSGHLVLAQKILGLKSHNLAYDIAAHLGTLFSVITIYFSSIKKLLAEGLLKIHLWRQSVEARLVLWIIIGTIPTALAGFLFKETFEEFFSSLPAVGIFLMVTGFVLLLTRFVGGGKMGSGHFADFTEARSMTVWQALVIGGSQAVAIAPGISRAGITIASGILIGLPRNTAALFSFMLAIPAILGAVFLQALDMESWGAETLLPLGIGLVVSYLAGLAGLWGVLHFVKRGRLEVFTVYLWIIGIWAMTQ